MNSHEVGTNQVLVSDGAIHFAVNVAQIINIDDVSETYTAELDLYFRWKDPRLKTKSKIVVPAWSRLCALPQASKHVAGCVIQGFFKEEELRLHELDEQGEQKVAIKYWLRADEESEWIEIDNFLLKEEPDDWMQFGSIFEGGDNKFDNVVQIGQLVDEPKILQTHRRLTNGETGEISQFTKVLAQLKENMELGRFPFDRQLLQFYISLAVPISTMRLLPASEWRTSRCKSKMTVGDFVVVQKQNRDHFLSENAFTGRGGKVYSTWKVKVHLERDPKKHIINVVVLLYVLVSASFTVFLIDIDAVNDRLSNTITFILAILALKWILADQLPKKTYQTWIDKYLIISYFLLSLPALELLWLEHLRFFTPSSTQESRPVTASWMSFAVCSEDSIENETSGSKEDSLRCLRLVVDGALKIVLISIWNAAHAYLLVRSCFCSDFTCMRHSWDHVRARQSKDLEGQTEQRKCMRRYCYEDSSSDGIDTHSDSALNS